MEFRGWPREALDWFDGLAADNSRAWFHANRALYDDAVRRPFEDLIDDVTEEFGELRVSRPNRDTRFSKDKTPYKTEVYAMSRRPDGAGWYVRLGRDGLSVGGGLYAPERARLAQVREAIADERTGPELQRIVAGLEANGISLLREGAGDDAVAEAMAACVAGKWAGHRIGTTTFVQPPRSMSQIGG